MPDPVPPIVGAVVLAAGAARRFGSDKLLATLGGRPLLQHVLDRLAEAGIDDPVVVLAPGRELAPGLVWRRARRVTNEHPADGLASSLKVGWAAARSAFPSPDAVLLLLGDQPAVAPDLVRALVAAPLEPGRPIVAPRYHGGGGPNPLRLETTADALVAATSGDRGLGPALAATPERVRWLDVDGSNPDVDVPADLARLADP